MMVAAVAASVVARKRSIIRSPALGNRSANSVWNLASSSEVPPMTTAARVVNKYWSPTPIKPPPLQPSSRHPVAAAKKLVRVVPAAIGGETGNLARTGFNHVCFAVEDVADVVKRMEDAGFRTRPGILDDFHSRKLVFLWGPGGVTVELSEWHAS